MAKRQDNKLFQFFSFLSYAFARFRHDKMQPRAASLTFTSLLAMVPLLAISFAIFAAFPAFESLKAEAQSYIFENFVPGVGNTVQEYLEGFTSKAQGSLSFVGIIFLGVTSVMLLLTISSTFNEIWRARQPKSFVARLLVYWAILTLGPIFLGANLSISSALFAYAQTSGIENYTGPLVRLAALMPFILVTIGFTAMFLMIPNYPVSKFDAFRGGLVAGFLLEFLKKAFGLYITSFPTYETIYGAMATIPIFLLWIYLSWLVILFSAELTASFPEWRAGSRKFNPEQITLSDKLASTLAVLYVLRVGHNTGQGVSEKQLSKLSGLGPERLVFALHRLEDLKFISKSDLGVWHLTRDLQHYPVYKLIQDLKLALPVHLPVNAHNFPWSESLMTHLAEAEEARKKIFGLSVDEILSKLRQSGEGNQDISEIPDDEESSIVEEPKLVARVIALLGIGTAAN
ncbi:MAG: YihY family inner membrane protein [Alphaproteobacteria bacterium]|nr:YihY family inner membrane protein [Alphaproteobacteria bacterium]